MGRQQGQGHLRLTRVAEVPDTGMVTGEVIIIGPQIIQPNLISLVDHPDPVTNRVEITVEIKEDRDLPIATAVWRCNQFDNYQFFDCNQLWRSYFSLLLQWFESNHFWCSLNFIVPYVIFTLTFPLINFEYSFQFSFKKMYTNQSPNPPSLNSNFTNFDFKKWTNQKFFDRQILPTQPRHKPCFKMHLCKLIVNEIFPSKIHEICTDLRKSENLQNF